MMLRPMKMEDAEFLLELKNYPETIMYSINTKEEIKMEKHLEFLKENLDEFQVIQDSQGGGSVITPIGVVRVDDLHQVSIWIKKEYWRKGIATKTLELVSKKGFWAKIVNYNIASMRAFINAGYKPKGFFDNYYIFQK